MMRKNPTANMTMAANSAQPEPASLSSYSCVVILPPFRPRVSARSRLRHERGASRVSSGTVSCGCAQWLRGRLDLGGLSVLDVVGEQELLFLVLLGESEED